MTESGWGERGVVRERAWKKREEREKEGKKGGRKRREKETKHAMEQGTEN